MPTYDYRCPDGHEFEDFVLKISSAKTELPCPTCGAVAPRRMSAGSGLLFKGSGFYITDYGKDGKKDQRDAAKASSDQMAKSAAAAEAKTGGEAKQAASAVAAPAASSSESKAAPKQESAPKPASAPPSKPSPKPGKSE